MPVVVTSPGPTPSLGTLASGVTGPIATGIGGALAIVSGIRNIKTDPFAGASIAGGVASLASPVAGLLFGAVAGLGALASFLDPPKQFSPLAVASRAFDLARSPLNRLPIDLATQFALHTATTAFGPGQTLRKFRGFREVTPLRDPRTGAGTNLSELAKLFGTGRRREGFIADIRTDRLRVNAPGAGLVPSIFTTTRRI